MKNKTVILLFSLIVFVSICFTACENQIINKWWVEKEPKAEQEDPEYISLLKYVPVNYDTVVEDKIVYQTVFVQLPPETITEYVYKQLPPEIIYQTITVPEYITVYQDVVKYIPPDKDTIIKWLEDPTNGDDIEKIVEKIKGIKPDAFIEYVDKPIPPEIIYQEVIKTEYVTVYQDVTKYVYIQTPPDKNTIIQWLTDTANEDDVKEIKEIIKESLTEDEIKEIIQKIPPKDIMGYLTDEQIKYIVSQQPAHMILQSIKIIDIEYVIFAGDTDVVNGPHGPKANTNLTPQEIDYNTASIKEMAQQLMDNPNYLLMLHGHANPTTFTDEEKSELETLSINRADHVKLVLQNEYNNLHGNSNNSLSFDERVSCSGYGGEKTLFGSNTQYSALNRRVEMILFAIVTTEE